MIVYSYLNPVTVQISDKIATIVKARISDSNLFECLAVPADSRGTHDDRFWTLAAYAVDLPLTARPAMAQPD